jgi:hypothetical protein
VEDVQELALVFVEALDLDVEDGVRVDLDAVVLEDVLGEPDLVDALDALEAAEEVLVGLELLELL